MKMKANNYLYFDIFFLAIIYLAGIIGIYFFNSELFVKTSFVSILIPLFLYCFRAVKSAKDYFLFSLIFIVGYFAEYLGVNFQLLFGEYAYGDSLGIKLYGVSLIIGLNWLLLVLVSNEIVAYIFSNKWVIIVLSSFLMVLIDVFIEPVAPKLDFWKFSDNPVPFSNYRDWFFIAVIMQYILSFRTSKHPMFKWSISYLIILLLFFSFFHLALT